MSRTKKKGVEIESLIRKIEVLLDTEIDNLPSTLQSIPPEKRVEFVAKSLQVIVKYRENHSGSDSVWSLPEWKD